jgi:hypothetical protein
MVQGKPEMRLAGEGRRSDLKIILMPLQNHLPSKVVQVIVSATIRSGGNDLGGIKWLLF